MNKIPYELFVPPPDVLRAGEAVPYECVPVDLATLCSIAEIQLRVTTHLSPSIFVRKGSGDGPARHLRGRQGHRPVLFVDYPWNQDRVTAIRVLEILAHGFHDYGARECLCPADVFAPFHTNMREGQHVIVELRDP